MELVTLFLFLIAFTKADHPGHNEHHHGDHHHNGHDEVDHGHEDHTESEEEFENIGGKLTLPNLKDCTNSKLILTPEKFSFSRQKEAINSFRNPPRPIWKTRYSFQQFTKLSRGLNS